jgi:hypothetical protein
VKDLVLVATPSAAERFRQALREPLGVRLSAELVDEQPSQAFIRRASELLAANPNALAVVALPSSAALELCAASPSRIEKRLVEPLSVRACRGDAWPSGPDFAFEWCSLSGALELRDACRARGFARARLDVSGCPAMASDEPELVLLHALALVEFALGETKLIRAEFGGQDSELRVELEARESGRVLVRARAGEPRLEAEIEGTDLRFNWRATPSEHGASVEFSEEREHRSFSARFRRASTACSAASRALRRLIDPGRGPILEPTHQMGVERCITSALAALPHPLPLSSSAFRRIEDSRPQRSLADFGWTGAPSRVRADASRELLFDTPAPSLPFEAIAFRAGVKPVVFLSVSPAAVDATLAHFPGAHAERLEGQARVALYISHDAALARRSSRLHSETAESASLSELGALMGYPPCCIDAFARQDERSNDTRNRYQTAARTTGARWHPELNNFGVMALSFFPCSYRCDEAQRQARRVFEALSSVEPGLTRSLERFLRGPLLYFEHGQFLRFEGQAIAANEVRYAAVAAPRTAAQELRELASSLACGDHLVLDETRFSVSKGGCRLFELERREPALGLLAPF